MNTPSIRRTIQLTAVAIALSGTPICHAQYALFDATTDTIAVSGGTTLGTAATFEAVFSLADASFGSIYFEQVNAQEHKQLAVSATSLTGFDFTLGANEQPFSSPTTVSLNTFHHFAFVRDGSEERLYFDGILTSTRAVSGDIDDSPQTSFPTAIGASYFTLGSVVPSFLGLLDSVRISSVARYSGASVTAPTGDMSADSDTLILYNFNPSDVSGGTISDLSGHGHSGTFGTGFAGATSPTIVAGPVSRPPVLTIRVSQVELCWNSKSNKTYQLQYRSDLTTNTWVDLGGPVAGTGSTNCLFDVVTQVDRRFYQLIEFP